MARVANGHKVRYCQAVLCYAQYIPVRCSVVSGLWSYISVHNKIQPTYGISHAYGQFRLITRSH